MVATIHHWAEHRPILVAAHPDDETIGASSQLAAFRHGMVVHLTDGGPRDVSFATAAGCASRDEYVALRRGELLAAVREAGLSAEHLYGLGYVDQEATLHAAEATLKLIEVVRAVGSRLMVTHPYEGGHPDHDAASLVARAACELIRRSGDEPPMLLEMTSYHLNQGRLETFVFLKHPSDDRDAHNAPEARANSEELEQSDALEEVVALNNEQRARKHRMFQRHRSQASVLKDFPIGVERFRVAPQYDYSLPPHDGTLYYETLGWPGEPWTGERWRSEAARALKELDLT